jgi:hypothetical protein
MIFPVIKIVARIRRRGLPLQRDDDGRAGPPGIIEYLFAELRQAFQDIRQKAVEEGWFGRVTTAAPVVEVDRAPEHGIHGDEPISPAAHEPADERRPSFQERCALPDHLESAIDHVPDHEFDFDR